MLFQEGCSSLLLVLELKHGARLLFKHEDLLYLAGASKEGLDNRDQALQLLL